VLHTPADNFTGGETIFYEKPADLTVEQLTKDVRGSPGKPTGFSETWTTDGKSSPSAPGRSLAFL
jgi:hypothetical protein